MKLELDLSNWFHSLPEGEFADFVDGIAQDHGVEGRVVPGTELVTFTGSDSSLRSLADYYVSESGGSDDDYEELVDQIVDSGSDEDEFGPPCPDCGATGDHKIGCTDSDGVEEGGCTECGAPAGEVCDPGCPNAAEEPGPDPDRYRESKDFDKFMNRMLVEERSRVMVDASAPSPQRMLDRSYREHPLGKTRIGTGAKR